mmetsp:Transcript_24759/g.30942  ORF Transcript_24759/g.30942 Transcript_24759/m.30942 type:complete len:199 (-) Transcript_24759:1123-1719(-)
MRASIFKRSSTYRPQKLSNYDKCQQKALIFDLYRKPFRLFLPDEQTMYRSLLGVILSVLTVVLMLFYAGWKLLAMFTLTDYIVRVHDQDNFYAFTEGFGVEDGFMVAAAVSSYDGSPEDITDLSIGRMKFVKKTWDGTDPIKGALKFVDVNTEPCDQDKLFGRTSDTRFYELATNSVDDAKNYAPKLLCAVNDDEIKI